MAIDGDTLRAWLDAERYDDAFAALVRDYTADIAKYVGRRTPPAIAEDIVQDVWLAAREALPRYRIECGPRIWLRVIARNKVVDVWRRKPEHVTLHSTMSAAHEVAGLFGVKLPSTPSKKLARARAASALESALAAIDEVDREMVALRFLDGLKPAEIATIVGVKPNTVSQRIVRAVRRLRELMAT